MTTMAEPYGPEDERFIYVVTAAGVEILERGALAVDGEPRPAPRLIREQHRDAPLVGAHD